MNLSAIPSTPSFPPDFNEPNIPIPLIVLLLVAIFVVVIVIVYFIYRESHTYQPGVDPHLRDNMPNFIYQPGVSGLVPFEERKCAWCQEEFTCGDQLSSLPSCGHVFHSDCIGEYMLRKNTCPVCRQPIALPEVQDWIFVPSFSILIVIIIWVFQYVNLVSTSWLICRIAS